MLLLTLPTFVYLTAVDDDSPPPTPSRRDSSPEVETPPRDIEMQTPDDPNTSFSRSLSKIESSLIFATKQKGTIDVWWLFDDGGMKYKNLVKWLFEVWHLKGTAHLSYKSIYAGIVRS